MLYAGIGSRRADELALKRGQGLGHQLAAQGWTLRSGHAPGMDQAFESGAGSSAEVYLPWASFESKVELAKGVRVYPKPSEEAYAIAEVYHPAWYALRRGGRALMARNVHQVLGYDCKTPVDAVLCWTPGGQIVGGTGQAIRIAMDRGITVYNFGSAAGVKQIENELGIWLSTEGPLF